MSTRILVIDDDQSMCELLQESLERSGWQVEWRTRGDEGLELIREKDFDVVITDVISSTNRSTWRSWRT